MNFADDLTADLPSPRDDEPASLRQDIIDELSDHLHCALQRELLASGGRQSPDTPAGAPAHDTREQTAWQSVLTRFGNPAALAHRLWWDAMKETIMTQRLVTTVTAIAVAGLCVLAVLGWRRVDADRRFVFDNLEANRELMRQMTAANQELLKQFQLTQQQLSVLAASGSSNPEWVPAEVIVRKGGTDGPPAEGVLVALQPANNAGAVHAEATTDANGVANLGIMRIGSYTLTALTPHGEYQSESVNIAPLKPYSQTLAAPATDPHPVDVAVRVVWPDGFDSTDVWVLLPGENLAREASGELWQARSLLRSGVSGGFSSHETYAISPEGKLTRLDRDSNSGNHRFCARTAWKFLRCCDLPDAAYSFNDITFVVASPAYDALESVRTLVHTTVATIRYGDQAHAMQTLTDESPRELVITVPADVAAAIEAFRKESDAARAQAAINRT